MVSSDAAGFDPNESPKALVCEHPIGGAQPVRPLWMASRREMIEAGRVGDEKR
jgi:hypothetical protein